MLRPPPPWRQRPSARGLSFAAPGATLVYEERLTPCRPFRQLVAEALATLSAGRVEERRRGTTAEGEVAAWARLAGRLEGAPVQLCLGSVFGDVFCTRLALTSLAPDRFAADHEASLELLRSTSLALGVRRQRVEYRSPPGWEPLPTGLVTEWLAPGFPADASHLIVYPASPSDLDPEAALSALLRDAEAAGLASRAPSAADSFVTTSGLSGLRRSVTGNREGRPLHRELAVLARSPYVYTLVLSCADPARLRRHLPTFLAVVASVVPVHAVAPPRDRETLGELWV